MSARSVAWLLLALAAALALVLASGRVPPVVVAGAGALVLAVLSVGARARVGRGPEPRPIHVVAAVALGVVLSWGVVTGGLALLVPAIAASGEALSRRCGQAAGAFALGPLLVLADALAPWILGPGPVRPTAIEPVPPRHRATLLVIALGVAVHGFYLAYFPPLLQVDSSVNLLEPPLFEPTPWHFHHPPVYALLCKELIGRGPFFLAGMVAVAALQHVAVIVAALAIERMVRLETKRPWAGILAGAFFAIDLDFALWAQLIMSEVLSTVLVVGAVALLVESRHRESASPWILGAGALSAAATLTRQAMEGWFVVGLAWAVLAPLAPRRRAVALFLGGALFPVYAQVLHNHAFQGEAQLTAATGHNIIYRLVTGLPALGDPHAPADELEPARRIIWEERDNLWLGAWTRLTHELGWNDSQINRAVSRLYVEQVRRYPVEFTAVTLDEMRLMLFGRESVQEVVDYHAACLPGEQSPWSEVPRAPNVPPLLETLTAFGPTSRWWFLLLAGLAPFVARRGRALALVALATGGYFLTVTALVEVAIHRYRLPFQPFLVAAAAIALAGVAERRAARRVPA